MSTEYGVVTPSCIRAHQCLTSCSPMGSFDTLDATTIDATLLVLAKIDGRGDFGVFPHTEYSVCRARYAEGRTCNPWADLSRSRHDCGGGAKARSTAQSLSAVVVIGLSFQPCRAGAACSACLRWGVRWVASSWGAVQWGDSLTVFSWNSWPKEIKPYENGKLSWCPRRCIGSLLA